ncbi:hypothetical protein B0H14DRAFT_3428242 [Mycena olivaceomarginata]|nr:hypothetical protein B0H14DRAFT_3428242 [Mycena olivaceomarginata]
MKLKFAAILHSLVVAALALPTPNPSIPEARADCPAIHVISAKLQLAGMACLLVASKLKTPSPLPLRTSSSSANGAYTGADMNSGS